MTFNGFHGITKSIKIMVYWIMTFKYSIKSNGVFD